MFGRYMMFTTKETENQFRLVMDEFDDSYTEPLSTERLQEILDKMPNRSEVIKRRRLQVAQERVGDFRLKRLNNLEDQVDPLLDSDKEAILQMELDNPDETWERDDAERARRISSSLTRRYYGKEGERAPPLGMFQGVLVFMVYPPTPLEHLESISKLMEGIKHEYGHEASTKLKPLLSFQSSLNGPKECSTFDVMSDAIDLWTARRDESVSKSMARFNARNSTSLSSTSRSNTRKTSNENPIWDYIAEESARQRDLQQTLDKLSQYELCRNKYVHLPSACLLFCHFLLSVLKDDRIANCHVMATTFLSLSLFLLPFISLDMIAQILEFHGAQVMPQQQCTIAECQELVRMRVGRRYEGRSSANDSFNESFEEDVGVPLEIVILFDPLYLETLDRWKDAMRVSVLYGSEAQTFEVPRLVTSEWVKQSQKHEYRLPEEGYYPAP
jgi:hypothetical protein